ncbi:Crp/Fnr family transcriptional regulator [Phenylobacterium sp. LjRoot219]|uniref:Crp/Fnr family transcriptional regulator n=1 Tax=Phenylobacterium sp. LjRoot219 TaxID=3342283 RepID=UPI003ECE2F16
MRRVLNATFCLIQALDRHHRLASEAEAELEMLSGPTEDYLSGDYMNAPGTPLRRLLVVAGWAAEQHTLPDGRKQLLRLALAGEVCGVVGPPSESRTQAVALTDVTVADLSKIAAMVRERHADPTLLAAWRTMEALRQASDLRHLVRLGSLSALERTGNLLLELYERSAFAGLTRGAAMRLPLTQVQLAEHLGLSTVHANRVIQQLRREGLIEAQSRQVVFRQLAALALSSCYELGTYPAAPPFQSPSQVRA